MTFNTQDEELKYLRYRLKIAYLTASTRPENCADAKGLLKGIRDDLKPYYEFLIQKEREAVRKEIERP